MSPSQNHSPNGASPAERRMEMLAKGPIATTLFKLSTPAIIGMAVIAIYNIVDTFFVSLLRDTTAVAATGVVFPIFQLIGAVGLTFGIGAASIISRRLGANDHKGAHEVGATALYSVIGVGLSLSAVGVVFTRPILSFFGATETILESATLYGRIIIGGSIFQMVNMTLNNLLRSEGATVHSSIGQLIGAIVNIILDPIFIFVLDMGIAGAAVATVISQALSTLWLSSLYLQGKGVIQPFDINHVRFERSTYSDMMHLGLPSFMRNVLGGVSAGILNNAAALWGDAALAAMSISFRIFSLVLMALVGLAQGLQPLAGYNYGARRFDRVRRTLHLVFSITTGVGAVAMVIGFVFAAPIMRIFTPQDGRVVVMGVEALRYFSVSMIPVGLVIMFGGTFQALGDGRAALFLATGQQGLFSIPLAYILPRVMGLSGVFLSQPLGFGLAFLVGVALYKRTHDRMNALDPAKAP